MYKLEIKHIKKAFKGEAILEDVNLTLDQGEFVSILGPSGCGKSTLLQIISGLVEEDFGTIVMDGKDIGEVEVNRRNIVMVFQDHLLFPHLSVEQNIAFGLSVRKAPREKIRETTGELLKLMGLTGYENRRVAMLSGGEKQRVALGRALAVKPEILLLDEPFSNLDQALRQEVRLFTKEIVERLNMTTLLVTHDREEAFELSQRVAVMFDGRIQQVESPKSLYQKPNSARVAEIIGHRNIQSANGACKVIPPHGITLITDQGGGFSVSQSHFSGGVIYSTVEGQGQKYHVESYFDTGLKVGDQVRVEIDPDSVIQFPVPPSQIK